MAGPFDINQEVNIFYLCVNAMIIFTMQSGFAFLEAGSVRSKNTTTILLKNCLDTTIGAVVYWATGWAFGFGRYGSDSNEFIGYREFFLSETDGGRLAYFFFEYTFACTSATIVSGAMAERTTMTAYMMYTAITTGWIYPVVTHWAWSGQGWLSMQLQYTDFAGSGVVHIVGGTASLIGTAMLGPRIGRFDANGNPKLIPGHSTVLVTLGFFFLWFGFLAFNAGSELGVADPYRADYAARAATNTILAPSAAGLTAVVATKIGYAKEEVTLVRGVKVNTVHPFGGHWSLLVLCNGAITGMVAICAGCAYVEPWAGICIGAIAGVVYVCINKVAEMALLDDPLGAVAVHLGGGFWGVIAVMLFAHPNRIPHIATGGVLYAWDRNAFVGLGKNLLGGACICAWTALFTFSIFGSLALIGHLRITPEAEEDGQDFIEGEPAYPIDLAVFSE